MHAVVAKDARLGAEHRLVLHHLGDREAPVLPAIGLPDAVDDDADAESGPALPRRFRDVLHRFSVAAASKVEMATATGGAWSRESAPSRVLGDRDRRELRREILAAFGDL